jgi:class 3 adenylate cyclase
VHRFEGAVNQHTGDGIMALFGDTDSSHGQKEGIPPARGLQGRVEEDEQGCFERSCVSPGLEALLASRF